MKPCTGCLQSAFRSRARVTSLRVMMPSPPSGNCISAAECPAMCIFSMAALRSSLTLSRV